MRSLALLAILALLSGCSSQAPAPAAVEASPAPAPPALPPRTVTQHHEGLLLYRLAGDGPLGSASQGDPHAFCVQLPEGVLAADFVLAWDDPRPLLLEFQDYSDGSPRHSNWGDDPVQSLSVSSPSSLHVEAPGEGEWQVWVGPAVADAARAWSLDVTWTLDGAAADVEVGGDCP